MADHDPHTDLVAALAALTDPPKSGRANVPGRTSYAYLELPDLLRVVRDTFKAHRLAVMQELSAADGDVSVTTVVVHTSGHRFVSPPCAIRTRGGAQDIGSAATYARRYSLAAFVGLAGSDDDDGAHAHPPAPPEQPAAPTPPKVPRRPSASDAQIRKLWATLTEVERVKGRKLDDLERHQYVGRLAGLSNVESVRQLTPLQMSQVIDQLGAIIATGPTPTTPGGGTQQPPAGAVGEQGHGSGPADAPTLDL